MLCVFSSTTSVFAQVGIIFDTDMDTDCDDAGALAILHALADRGEAEILATVVSSRYPWSVPCVEAIDREIKARIRNSGKAFISIEKAAPKPRENQQ